MACLSALRGARDGLLVLAEFGGGGGGGGGGGCGCLGCVNEQTGAREGFMAWCWWWWWWWWVFVVWCAAGLGLG